jgi:hypothetical protein
MNIIDYTLFDNEFVVPQGQLTLAPRFISGNKDAKKRTKSLQGRLDFHWDQTMILYSSHSSLAGLDNLFALSFPPVNWWVHFGCPFGTKEKKASEHTEVFVPQGQLTLAPRFISGNKDAKKRTKSLQGRLESRSDMKETARIKIKKR